MTQKPKPRGGRRENSGRPPYQPSLEDRVSVEQMKFCGESDNVIAAALKIDARTLRKHFAYEIENGHSNRRREVIGLLFDAAQKGNVSAQKRLDEMGRVAGAAAAVKRREAKPPALGKKEEQQRAAERVEGKFSPPAPPKLVVNNAS